MKWMCSIFFVFTFIASAKFQSFDDFTIDKEVMVFAKKEFNDLKNFNLGIKTPEEENQWYLDSLEYSPWYVGDFNEDKIADLFITGQEKKDQANYLILGKDELDEEKGFTLIPVYAPKKRGNLLIPFIEETRKGPMIIFKHFETVVRTEMKNDKEVRIPRTYQDYYKMGLIKKDTLVYHYGGIVEYNPRPISKEIRFIQLHSFCQFGGCPDFRMKIDSARLMILSNIKNTDENIGKYAAFCEANLFKQIFDLANYIRVAKSSQKFGEESADRVLTMIIAFQDDSAITWYDYEQGPSLAISRLYDLMHQAKTTAVWEYKEAEPD